MKTIRFTLGCNLCLETLEGDEIEVEIGPERYRALYEQDWRGRITEIVFERNDARHGKPDYWVRTELISIQVQARVIDRIGAEFREEQQRIASMEDA